MTGGGPIIVTALLRAEDFAWLNGLRLAHYPPDRNRVPAHLTLFRHLPPSLAGELDRRLKAETGEDAPAASLAGPELLDHGVALRVRSEGLEALRERLEDAFVGLLTPQDAGGWRPHVTIQNKAAPAAARALHAVLLRERWPRPLILSGLASWRYREGSWEPIRRHRFSRSGRSPRN
ncbi:MAG TPA: 2'-5' RNA ligase family protein [Sphingomonas sp.]|nr:2'-5' RNA ligase family protein [Sphingomonas sp.]